MTPYCIDGSDDMYGYNKATSQGTSLTLNLEPAKGNKSSQAQTCFQVGFYVNRFYPKTQLSRTSWARHSHCDSADPPTDWLEVCCVFNRTGRGGVMCDVWCGGPQEGE